jgi:hypothetical protein
VRRRRRIIRFLGLNFKTFRAFEASLLRIAAVPVRKDNPSAVENMMHAEEKRRVVVVVARRSENGIKRWRLGA